MVSLLALSLEDEGGERPLNDNIYPIISMLSEEMQDDMRNNQPYVVDDLWALRYLPPALTDLKKCGVRSFIQIPLLVRGKLIGFLHIYDKNVDLFTPEYIGIAREIVAPLSIALGNVQLFVAENVARNQAETLRQVAAQLNTSLELEPLLGHILKYLEDVIPCGFGCWRQRVSAQGLFPGRTADRNPGRVPGEFLFSSQSYETYPEGF